MNTKEKNAPVNAADFGTFESKDERSGLLNAGEHVVTVESASLTRASKSDDYEDQTPQIAVVFRNAVKRMITMWLNLLGYLRFSELTAEHVKGIKGAQLGLTEKLWNGYSVEQKIATAFKEVPIANSEESYAVSNITKKRVPSPARTADAKSIVNRVLAHGGIAEGTSFNSLPAVLEAMKGLTIGVSVVNDPFKGMRKVRWTLPATDVEAEAEATA